MTPQPGSPVDFCFPSGKSSCLLGEVGASKVGLLSCGSWHFGASSEGAGSLQWAFGGVLSYCSCLERGTAFVGAGGKGRPFEREEPNQETSPGARSEELSCRCFSSKPFC